MNVQKKKKKKKITMLQNLLFKSKWRPAVIAGSPLIFIATEPFSFLAIYNGL